MRALAIVYLIQSVIFFVGIFAANVKSNIKGNVPYYILLLVATYVGYMFLQSNMKTYIVIGFVLSAIIAYFYSLVSLNEEVVKEANLSLGGALFVCVMSIFSWPQIIALNVADFLIKKNDHVR